jgi:hypothetical protein
MALSDAEKNLILETIAVKFNGDIKLFEAWLERSKLETDTAKIQSAIRNAQNKQAADTDAYNAQIEDLQAQLNAKQAEIDAL